jgi:magnesium transporter
MTPDYISVQADWTVQEVLEHIREVGKDKETIDVIYVVNDRGEFLDDMRIREILLQVPKKLSAILSITVSSLLMLMMTRR